ncbi:MAG TPA: hypothetical protein DD417_10670 [Elusimicrobia bacterium]|nr:hypothetical protein [Elusimicrobiota bacterium]
MDNKFLDPTSVNDVETARLALRWSLEKIHALQDELNKAKETATDAVDKLRLTTEQIAQKDAAILRWQSTIKAWEANYKDQAKLEAEIRARLAKEMTFEEDAGHKEARRQLELHIEAFKTEIREKEAAMGDLRRQIIDAVKTARIDKEKEMLATLAHQERAFEETKESLLERLRIQQEVIRAKERDLEEQQRLLDEKIRAKETEFRRRYERQEEELLKHNREAIQREEVNVAQRFESKLAHQEALLRQKEAQIEGRRSQLEAEHAKRMEELEAAYQHKHEKEWGRLQERLEVERKLLEEHYRQKEAKLDEDILRRNEEVQTHYQQTEEALIAKYQTIQKQLIEKEKQLWAGHQKHLDAFLEKNRAEINQQREELEASYEKREKDLFEKQKTLEADYQSKEADVFTRQQQLEADYRAKEAALTDKRNHLYAELADRTREEWEAQSRKLSDALEEQRRKLEIERQTMSANLLKKEEELLARAQQMEAGAAEHWAQRERELQAEHQKSLTAARDRFAAEIDAERRQNDAVLAKREEELSHAFLTRETDLQRTLQGEQTGWLRQQEGAFDALRKQLLEKHMKEAAASRTEFEAQAQSLETQKHHELLEERKNLNAEFRKLSADLESRSQAQRKNLETEMARREAEAAAAARIAALPAVAGASVRAVLPDRLVVTVRERAPLLVWVTAAERFAVDAEGRLFAAVQEDPPGVDGPLPTVSDERRSAAGLRVGEQLAHTDLLVARQLVAVTPALLGSRARTLEIHVTDNQGYVLDARPTGWSAVFGIYTASTRPPDLVPRQVQCLRSLLADTGEALQRVILAPEGGSCGTYLEP